MLVRAGGGRVVLALVLSLALNLGGASCGVGEKPKAEAWRMGIEFTRSGNYRVEAREDGRDKGVALFDGGSFRAVIPNGGVVVIFNGNSGDSWLYNPGKNVIKRIDAREAASLAGFLPSRYLDAYFQMEGFWSEEGFKMVTDDGRAFRIAMDGPRGMPTLFEVSDRRGVFKRVEWEYSRIGEASEHNFLPPEGAGLQ